MDKCKECKHTIFTGKNIFEKINEINNKEIIDKYTMTARCVKCGAVLQKSILQWWAVEIIQIIILIVLFFSIKAMSNLYFVKIFILTIESIILYMLYKILSSIVYIIIPWRFVKKSPSEMLDGYKEALHEKILRYKTICRTLTFMFLYMCIYEIF